MSNNFTAACIIACTAILLDVITIIKMNTENFAEKINGEEE